MFEDSQQRGENGSSDHRTAAVPVTSRQPPKTASRAAPALVTVAGFDPLRDQGAAYAAALRAVGVPATLPEEGLVHGYADSAGMVPEARRAVDRIVAGVEGMVG